MPEEIRRISGQSVKGPYSRYKAKKWGWIGNSGVRTPSGGAYEVFVAEFHDKFDTPYTFVVVVDLIAGRITPLEDLDDDTQERIRAWIDRPDPDLPSPNTPTVPKKAKPFYSIWLGEVDVPQHPMLPNPTMPRLLLGSSKDEPLTRISQLNAGEVDGSGFVERHPITPRLDLLDALPKSVRGQPRYSKMTPMQARKAKIRDHLRDKGFIVDLNNGNNVFTVYVVNLSDDVGPRVGPHRWVYVGQTRKTPEERLQDHKAGRNASKWVTKYGERLNYRLFAPEVPQVRFVQEAEAIEKRLAEDLRRRGFNVKGGH